MRTADIFEQELKRLHKLQKRLRLKDYSDEVQPVSEIISSMACEDELAAFKTAFARALAWPDERTRHWARGMCVGLICFRDTILPPVFARRDVPEARREHSGPTRDSGSFADALTSLAREAWGVHDALRLFRGARAGSEPRAYLDGVEQILSSDNEHLRAFGIEVCVAFVLRPVPWPPALPQGSYEVIVHSREQFRLNPNMILRARKPVSIHLPYEILSPEGTLHPSIVELSNQKANLRFVEPKPAGGVPAVIVTLEAGDEICLARSVLAVIDDGTQSGVVVFDARDA